MQPMNLKSMFASAGMIFEKLETAEDLEINALDKQLKSLEVMLKVLDQAHKMAVSRCTLDKYEESFNKLNPQLKNYDVISK